MIDEEAELGLISRPMRGAVKGKGQEQDIGRRKKRCFGEEGAGQKANHQYRLEYRGKPGQQEPREIPLPRYSSRSRPCRET
jgi:hypothetical protein